MNKLLLIVALITSIHAETWKCSVLVTTESDGERVFHDIASTISLNNALLTLRVKDTTVRTYQFWKDTLEGDRYFKRLKGDGMLLVRRDIIAVSEDSESYILSDCK